MTEADESPRPVVGAASSSVWLAPAEEDLYGAPEEEGEPSTTTTTTGAGAGHGDGSADDGLLGFNAEEIENFTIEPLDRTKLP